MSANIRDYFVSRFPNGLIAEYDFSQLEVIALAELSGDITLINDIASGVDMHCMNAAFLFGSEYEHVYKMVYIENDPDWIKKRKVAKGPGFLIQYGGGAKTMAEKSGLSVKACQEFIDKYYKRYRGVRVWQESVMKQVRSSRRVLGGLRTKKGYPQGYGEYVSITGRRYGFLEFDNDYRPGTTSFSPTQMKNYPVQGFATADIVPIALGKLYRNLKNSPYADDILMINTVHDSVVLDCRDTNTLSKAHSIIKHSLESVVSVLRNDFGIEFTLPLKVDATAGPTWGSMEPIDKVIPMF